jgi:hypothetical protein
MLLTQIAGIKGKLLASQLTPVMETQRHASASLQFTTDLHITQSMFCSERERERRKPSDMVKTSFCTYLQLNVSEMTSRNIKVVLYATFKVHFNTLG